ncbi:MAG: hypothetical protein HGA45_21245 [Chloroflexales bacterium]|nr:hypothetical protein [Chloroflexales bacterium]
MAVFDALNALGRLYDRDGRVVRGGLDRTAGIWRSYREQLVAARAADEPLAPQQEAFDFPTRVVLR